MVETEWATDLGVVGSRRSPGVLAVSAAGRREFNVARALLSEAGGWRSRSGGGVIESRMSGSVLEVTPASPLLVGESGFSAGLLLAESFDFSAGNSLFAS